MAPKINKNTADVSHNTSVRTGPIQYICIHYVGATGDAKANVTYYSQKSTTNASADFFVGHNGDIWQYNPNPITRYCWAVGGNRQSAYGGTFYGKCRNANSISIEMCVKNKGDKKANSKDWYFEDATIKSTVELVKHLMVLYKIPADCVIRHYDVTGKFCPGVVGWNPQSGSTGAWDSFKEQIEADDLTAAVDKLYKAGIINSPDYWKQGKGYSDANVVALIKKVAVLAK